MILRLYSLGWWLATPLAMLYLLWRSRRQPEYRRHWAERWGLHRRREGDAPLVWVHAVSVGETRAAQPLVDALLRRDERLVVLITHMTPTGRQTGEEVFSRRWGARVVQAYLPYDYAFAQRRFLAAWRPSLGVVMETELWPNLCDAARRAGVPLAFVNARLSEKSLAKGLRWGALTVPALASVACVLAQTDADARRIARLGRADVKVAGNMKFDVDAPAAMLERGRAWRARLGARPVVLAASTRDGEEELLLRAWRDARGDERALLLLVPRHPQRFDEVDAIARGQGWRVARRSALLAAADAAAARDDREDGASGAGDGHGGARGDGRAGARVDVLLGDSMGEMFAYYAASDVAILGGSLLPFGGQNLIEACAAGVPVVTGPHTFNFAEAAAQAVEAGAAVRAADAPGAIRTALSIVEDPGARALASSAAAGFALRHRGATARSLDALARFLPASAATG